jgi:alkyldihydroxyacetonephosphate synthase
VTSQPPSTTPFDPAARWAAPDPEPLVGEALRDLLAQAFGLTDVGASPAAVTLAVAPSALGDAVRAALVAAVGAAHVVTDDVARAAHANGMS